ncbi:glycosyltransferase [Hymenobacter sp. HSC-4F20]|uniref:glycosyltransferase family 2 protein n=1 Tax=Hymenobacter sp. HSC-4F20 TaxID=2864135 RepID=UPI001C731558|nr:glycosyltransferase family 2 protein [Hymenobacter sp. HSC-4F20]MBX0290435.1 glycosyltransferase [Hymenobacter sp. HSC-4F20]
MPSVLLSLVSWNSADSIEACLHSVLAQSWADFELWVVDNNSQDDTCARVEALAATDARVRLHRLTENTGFCGGHNYALDRTETDLVLLVNPDVEMEPDYLACAVAAIRRDPRIGTVCGLLLQNRDADPRIDSAGMVALPDGRFSLRLHGQPLSTAGILEPTYVDGADGALPLFRRRFIDDLRVQGEFFDSRFFAHKEDWDIAWRGRLYGWHTLFEPACRALHPRQFLPSNLRLRRRLNGAIKADAVKNQWLLLLKNTPPKQVPGLLLRALPRQVGIVAYAVLAERKSLRAVRYLWQHWREVLVSRQLVQQRARRGWLPAPVASALSPPLLSICVPTYHRPTLLARALRSIGPLPAEVEVIISDNSTHDAEAGEQTTQQVLGKQPPQRWHYHRNPPGGNAATNWRACVERARGQYVLMLHDDDYLLPGGLETMLETLRQLHGQQHAILFGVSVVDADGQELRRQVPARAGFLAPEAAIEALLTNSSLIRIPGLVVSRKAYQHTGGPDPSQQDTDDTDLWLRVFAYGGLYQVPSLTAAYSVHDGALTTGVFHEQNIQLLQRIFQKARAQQLLPEPRLRRAEARFFHQFVLAGAYRALQHHDAASARRTLKLLELPTLRHLPVPARWLPIRLGLSTLARLNFTPPLPTNTSWAVPST